MQEHYNYISLTTNSYCVIAFAYLPKDNMLRFRKKVTSSSSPLKLDMLGDKPPEKKTISRLQTLCTWLWGGLNPFIMVSRTNTSCLPASSSIAVYGWIRQLVCTRRMLQKVRSLFLSIAQPSLHDDYMTRKGIPQSEQSMSILSLQSFSLV